MLLTSYKRRSKIEQNIVFWPSNRVLVPGCSYAIVAKVFVSQSSAECFRIAQYNCWIDFIFPVKKYILDRSVAFNGVNVYFL